MRVNRTELLSVGFVILSFAIAGALYHRLPDPVPTHWNSHGVADGFMRKPWGAFVLPAMMILVGAVFWVIPRLSPRGSHLDRSQRALRIVQVAVMAFLMVVNALALLAGAGVGVSIDRVVPVALGALLMVIGTVMGQFRKNFFVGIRTPWTLASDEVWLRTHRLGGRLFVIAGVLLVVAGALGGPAIVIALPILVVLAGVTPAVYSLVIHRQLQAAGRPPDRKP